MTASTTGTATDFEDLFTQIVSFLTTDADLVAANEQYVALYQHRDGIAGMQTNLTEQTAEKARKILHGCRYEPRSLNINSPINNEGFVQCGGFSAGVSFIRFELRSAAEITNVRLRAAQFGSAATNMIRNFRLEYSDDDSAWSTALTISSSPVYTVNEIKDFTVTPAGAHLYWRVVIDSISSGATVYWKSLLLQSAGGDIENHFGSEVIFQAPGAAGTDEIYTGIRSEYDSAHDWYNLFLNGFTGYDANIVDFFDQPGGLPGFGAPTPMMVPIIPCWNSAMPFWLSASGRSFRIGVMVSSSYESGYLGFILPYATPSQYPYPLIVGGSLMPTDGSRGAEWRYSYSNYRHSAYTTPSGDSVTAEKANATLYMRRPDGAWASVAQRDSSNLINDMTVGASYPFTVNGPATGVWPTCVHSASSANARLPYRDLLTGGYVLQPCVIVSRLPALAAHGYLEGICIISGFNNAAENTGTFNGVDYVVMQNAGRTETHEYFAMSLP